MKHPNITVRTPPHPLSKERHQTRPSPSIFAYCKQSETGWMEEKPGNDTKPSYLQQFHDGHWVEEVESSKPVSPLSSTGYLSDREGGSICGKEGGAVRGV